MLHREINTGPDRSCSHCPSAPQTRQTGKQQQRIASLSEIPVRGEIGCEHSWTSRPTMVYSLICDQQTHWSSTPDIDHSAGACLDNQVQDVAARVTTTSLRLVVHLGVSHLLESIDTT